MSIEHEPWVPNDFATVGGHKIAIVGYSHHRHVNDKDSPEFTRNVVQRVIDGEQKGDAFFTPVSRYFGFEDKREFWSRVLFFNFVPECIGLDHEKYRKATEDQVDRAQARVLRILSEHTPDKVFVFTTKGWNDFPRTDQERASKPCTRLIADQKNPSRGRVHLRQPSRSRLRFSPSTVRHNRNYDATGTNLSRA